MKENTYYINFERQGNEIVTYKVQAKNVDEAYAKACVAYVEGEGIDICEMEKENLQYLENGLIEAGTGEELDVEEEMEEAE